MLVAPNVRKILAPNPSPMTGPGTNSYLVGGDQLVVIDPGPDLPDHVDAILTTAATTRARVVGTLVTHAHRDHLPAAYQLRERTGAPIYGHHDVPGVDHPLADGEQIPIGALRLTCLATPGHADDHYCFWIASERLLFAGDLIAGEGTVVLSESAGALERYLTSLRRVESLGASIILPGHGPVVPDGRARIRVYLEHRGQRDQQILAALGEGASTVDALVRRLYVDTPQELHLMAARNVRAHLERLATLGQAIERAGLWELPASD